MKNRVFKKITVLFLCFAAAFMLPSCGDKAGDATVYFEASVMPANIDPQLAATYEELTVAANIFEGLFRKTEEGIKPAACDSYTLSEDGLTYTFKLRDDLLWSDKNPVTADDFVFGIKRAVSPATKAPFAAQLFPIKNAKDIYEEKQKPGELGISAEDDGTLVITLESPAPEFLEVLTKPVSFPCSEKFFDKAKGRYGRTMKTVMGNGAFRLTRWKEKTSMRLQRSDSYGGNFTARPRMVIISFNPDAADRFKRLKNENIDLCYIGGNDVSAAKEQGFSVSSYKNATYVMLFSQSTAFIKEKAVKAALVQGIDKNTVSVSLPAYLDPANALVPDEIILRGRKYREAAGVKYSFSYDPEAAKKALTTEAGNLRSKKLPSITVLYPDHPGLRETAGYIVQSWQQDMGAYINIAGATDTELQSKMKSGGFDIMIFPLCPDNTSAAGFLGEFALGGRLGEYSSDSYKTKFEEALKASDDNELISKLSQCEKMLIFSDYIIPVAFSASNLAVNKGLTGVFAEHGGNVIEFFDIGKK